MSPVYYLYKQFGPRSGPMKVEPDLDSMFDTKIVFLKKNNLHATKIILHAKVNKGIMKSLQQAVKAQESLTRTQSELPRPIPRNQTTDVHRGSTLIKRVIM